jgi:hypothetical protein
MADVHVLFTLMILLQGYYVTNMIRLMIPLTSCFFYREATITLSSPASYRDWETSVVVFFLIVDPIKSSRQSQIVEKPDQIISWYAVPCCFAHTSGQQISKQQKRW